jgi:hypothetical protein
LERTFGVGVPMLQGIYVLTREEDDEEEDDDDDDDDDDGALRIWC